MGWQHAFGVPPRATHALAGASFAVSGAPAAADMFVLGAGLNLDVSADTTLDVSYDGRLGGGAQAHALTVAWNGRF